MKKLVLFFLELDLFLLVVVIKKIVSVKANSKESIALDTFYLWMLIVKQESPL
jgi:hypothetical protein